MVSWLYFFSLKRCKLLKLRKEEEKALNEDSDEDNYNEDSITLGGPVTRGGPTITKGGPKRESAAV